MKGNKLWLLLAILGLTLPLTVCAPRAAPVAPTPAQATPTPRPAVKPSVPMDVELSFSAPPSLNQVVILTFWVRPLVDAPNTTVQITLPDGFQLVEGQSSWQGDISRNEAREFQVRVRAVKTGLWTITAEAVSQLPGGAVFGRPTSLSINITEEDTTILTGTPLSPQEPATQSTATEVDKLPVPMDVELSFSAPPSLNQVVILTFWVRPLVDAPNTTVQITLPDGFQLVEGQSSWQGDISRNEAREFQVRVRAVKTGLWTITAEAVSQLPGGAVFGRPVSLYVSITETDVTVSRDAKRR